MGDWGRYFLGEEPGSMRPEVEPLPRHRWAIGFSVSRRLSQADQAASAAAWEAARAAEKAEREAEFSAKKAAHDAALAAEKAARAAERAAEEAIVARCVTIDASPGGGKRYTLRNFEFRGCTLHRQESLALPNRVRATRLLVLPVEDAWSVSWENCRDGERFAVTTANAEGQSQEFDETPSQTEIEPPAPKAASGLSHNPFAALLGKR